MTHILRSDFLESTRGRIIGVIRRGPAAVDEVAAELGLTGNAVRAQLATLQRDGLVRSAGVRAGATKPAQTYELTPELEQLLSRAYIPLLAQLVRVYAAKTSASEFNAAMRDAGRGLARELPARIPSGPLVERVAAACQVMNRELGATASVHREDGALVIRGTGCPLAALTGKHRGVCLAIETMLTELLGARTRECCDRDARPRCCFRVTPNARSPVVR